MEKLERRVLEEEAKICGEPSRGAGHAGLLVVHWMCQAPRCPLFIELADDERLDG